MVRDGGCSNGDRFIRALLRDIRKLNGTKSDEELNIYEILNLPDGTIVKMITEEGYGSQLIKVINHCDTKCLVFKETGKHVPITDIWLNVKYKIIESV